MHTGPEIERREFDEVDSTNAYLRREVAAGMLRGPTLVWAGRQTAGRGRRSRNWLSPAGGVWMSLAVPFPRSEAPDRLRGLGVRLGVAVREGVDVALAESGVAEHDRARLRLKWPNDLVVVERTEGGGPRTAGAWKKVGGLLAEVELSAARHNTPGTAWLVIGVGVNVNIEAGELEAVGSASGAISLCAAFGSRFDLTLIRECLAERLRAHASGVGTREVIDAYRAWLVGIGVPMRFTLPDGTSIAGVLESIDPAEGWAAIRTSDGRVERCALDGVEPMA